MGYFNIYILKIFIWYIKIYIVFLPKLDLICGDSGSVIDAKWLDTVIFLYA